MQKRFLEPSFVAVLVLDNKKRAVFTPPNFCAQTRYEKEEKRTCYFVSLYLSVEILSTAPKKASTAVMVPTMASP